VSEKKLTTREVIELQDRYLMKSVEAWNDRVFVEGHGAVVTDLEGREYIDCFSGVSVLNVGHTHPRVVEAVRDQVGRLTHLSTLYRTVPMPLLARKLSEISPMDRGRAKVFFCNSGTEANEHALTLARIATGKFELIGLQNGFYGRGGLTMSVTGLGSWRAGLGPFMPGAMHLPGYHCYRCSLGHQDPERCGLACARYLEGMLKSQTCKRVAAVIVETIQGIGGIVCAPRDYFKVLKPILEENKILLIVDEVQTGFGRTGRWFGVEHYGLEPDVITMAKALGGGLPIGAVMARAEVADSFPGPDFSTFGGNPVSCRAALAGIEVIEEEKLADNAREVGAYLKEELLKLSQNHHLLDDVQGQGLMIGAEIVSDKKTRAPAGDAVLNTILEEALKQNVLIGRGGFYYNRIRFQPALCLSREQAGKVLQAFDRALAAAEKKAR